MCCLSWSSRETDQLTYARNSPTRSPEPSPQTNTMEPKDIIILSETIPNIQSRICCTVQFGGP